MTLLQEELCKRLQKAEDFVKSTPSLGADSASDELSPASPTVAFAQPHPNTQALQDELQWLITQLVATAQPHAYGNAMHERRSGAVAVGEAANLMNSHGSGATIASGGGAATCMHARQSATALCAALEMLQGQTQRNARMEAHMSDMRMRLEDCERCAHAFMLLICVDCFFQVLPVAWTVQQPAICVHFLDSM